MKAKYDFRVLPNLQGKEGEQELYPQLVTSGTKNLKDLMERASRHTMEKPQLFDPRGQVSLTPCGKI